MDERVDTLETMLSATTEVLGRVRDEHLGSRTPCDDFDVAALLDHVCVWVQVFDGAVNDSPVWFDPSTHHVGAGWTDVFATASASIVDGLRTRGVDRPVTMTQDPIPGEFVLNMLLSEYIGHGWDLSRAMGIEAPYADAEAVVALGAARTILKPQYRGPEMFGAEVVVADDAAPIDRFVAFIGRDPHWTPVT